MGIILYIQALWEFRAKVSIENQGKKQNKAELEELKCRRLLLEAEISNRNSFIGGSCGDEFDLLALLRAAFLAKWAIAGMTVVFTIVSAFVVLSLPDEYTSTAVLVPASSGSPKFGKLEGLASLAGIDLGGTASEDKTAIAMKVMRTWGFVESFIEENEIQTEVFAGIGWSRDADEVLFDEALYDGQKKNG